MDNWGEAAPEPDGCREARGRKAAKRVAAALPARLQMEAATAGKPGCARVGIRDHDAAAGRDPDMAAVGAWRGRGAQSCPAPRATLAHDSEQARPDYRNRADTRARADLQPISARMAELPNGVCKSGE